jgi:hypothetical protein
MADYSLPLWGGVGGEVSIYEILDRYNFDK